jgi:hypothetical protein
MQLSSSVWQIANVMGLLCWFLDYFDWRTLVNNVRFLSVLFFALLALSQIDKKPIMNPKSESL